MGNIADTNLLPGVYVTIDNSLANTSTGATFKTVFFGQKTASGTTSAETLAQVFSAEDAATQFGNGSMLSEMFGNWFKANSVSEVYAIALDDAAASTAATKTLFVTATSVEAGTLYLYVNGNLSRIGVTADESADDIATALATAINADVTLPITASIGAGEGLVTCIAKNKGVVGNQIDVRFNNGTSEAFPSGVSVAAFADVTGATDPDIADAIAALPDEVYNVIVNPYTDSASLADLKTELDRRWGNDVQLDGVAIMAYGGTASEVITYGNTLNCQYFNIIDSGKNSMTPEYSWAPALASRVSYSAEADPAVPFRTLILSGVDGDTASDKRTKSERKFILSAGIGTHLVGVDGTVTIDRLVTTYKTNSVGAADTSYLNSNTTLSLSKWRQAEITRMLSSFGRSKLAEDGTSFGAGQLIATPASIKTAYIDLYQEFVTAGILQDIDNYVDTLSVTIDSTNRSKVNVVQQPTLVGQLYQFDSTVQFIV